MDGGRTDLDLRRLRSFVAVAERLHFGQAAAALHVTQPALSRQIQQLEHDLGVSLFRRSSREVALTPAGEQFLQDSRELLAAARAAQNRARRIAAGEGVLKVGFMLSSDITAPLHAFSAREPEVRIELVRLRWWSQSADLLDGTADVGFVRLPVDADRLRLLPLYQEGLCAVLPVRHPLAGEDTVGLRALADEPLLHYAGASPAWSAVWNADPRPDGTRWLRGPDVHDMEEILAYVRAGSGVVMVPESVAAVFPRPDIAYVPLADVSPGTVALAWDGDRPSPLVETFVDATRTTAVDVTRPTPGSAPAP
ncbi:LysR substrate-binding domain-containing protein [Streptomyces werraensis]|uniref:LysR family transcriptional regulator n=1 Tax=Streptomyces werraensis TaxID=68284 RepID=UPI00167AB191|nr:LysR family transcriptional regulator [Streptomyces werraensis]